MDRTGIRARDMVRRLIGTRALLDSSGLAFTALLVASPLAAQVPRLWGDLTPGDHDVGYRAYRLFDDTRTFGANVSGRDATEADADARLMTLRIWFPAVPESAGSPMALGDYLLAHDDEGPVTPPVLRRLELDLDGLRSDLCCCGEAPQVSRGPNADDCLDSLLATKVIARSATPTSEAFPVVLYSLGADMHSLENVVLWEYLASHGYVVVVTPSVGHESVAMEPIGPTAVEVRARDLEFALEFIRDLPYADPHRVATVGFSLGGAAALLVAMRNLNVDAVVGLDASYNLARRLDMLRRMPFFDPTRLRVPLLSMRQDERGMDMGIVESLVYSDRYDIEIRDMEARSAGHHAFTSLHATTVEFFDPGAGPQQLATFQYNRDVFELVAQRVRTFLDASLRRDSAALEMLQTAPGISGVPTGMVRQRLILGKRGAIQVNEQSRLLVGQPERLGSTRSDSVVTAAPRFPKRSRRWMLRARSPTRPSLCNPD